MKCVSKCFIGRPFRVYSLLFLGVVVGFALSTLLQSLNIEAVVQRGRAAGALGEQRRRPDYPHFANLEEEEAAPPGEPEIAIGGYDYDSVEYNNEGEQQRPADVQAPVASINEGRPVRIEGDARTASEKYLSDSWQARSVRDTGGGLPPRRLTDELRARQTLLVAVITSVSQLMSQTLSVHGTWAPDCQQVLYFVGEVETMPHLPHGMEVVQLEGIDDKQAGWAVKEFSVVKYLSEHYLERVEWFLLVGDETYVSAKSLQSMLNKFDSAPLTYLGRASEAAGDAGLCRSAGGVVYSRGLLEQLHSYLPMCWPGQGDGRGALGSCLSSMGVRCTHAIQTQELFLSDAKTLVESASLSQQSALSKALVIHPVKFPKFMYRLHSHFQELLYNSSLQQASAAASSIHDTHPFIPAHLRSSFSATQPPTLPSSHSSPSTEAPPPKASQEGGVVIRPRYVPKNKFELNYWEYFNQTRLMAIMHESPARGIIGGAREEARFALTKAIYLANQGVAQSQRYVFDKLENGYHRVDPMRGSEFILDFVFRRNADKNVKLKKRLSILRPFHETIVPVDSVEQLPTVNFVVVLSGLSHRLEHFLLQYEHSVLQLGEDATLTIVLFNCPDAAKVRLMVHECASRYDGARMSVVDAPGKFARGVGLHRGAEQFQDDQLLFFVDVDFDISSDFLQRCRLNTLPGRRVYFPVFFKLYNPGFVQNYALTNTSMLISRQNGHWAHYSYGMVCLYAADYRKTGGFDLHMQGWGEEDVDFLNKVLQAGFEVFRAPDPGLIHNWHRKVCDNSTVSNVLAYEHCLQSRGENLADRIELAQYVFHHEELNGNYL